MKNARTKTKKHSVISLRLSPISLLLCIALLAALLTDSVQAQDWRFEPIVKFGVEYDDNATLRIRTDEEVVLEGLLLDIRADINYVSPTTSFFLQPRALLRNYPNEPDFDTDDYFLRSLFRHRGESSTIGFRVTYDQQAIRTAERDISDLEIDDPTELTDDDTGLVLFFGSRNKLRISPYWNYRLSNVSSIGADIDYYDVRYADFFAGFLSDYTDARLNLNYRRNFSSVFAGLLTVTARKFDTSVELSDITGSGLQVGFERELSEKMQLTVMIGVEDTDHESVETDPEVVGNVTLIRNLETIRLLARYRRSIAATGAGRLSVRDSINLNFRRRLSEKIIAGLGVRAYQSRGIGGLPSIDDRNYIQLQSSFLWYLTQSMVIEADYRYTILDRTELDGGRSNSNQINLWFVYQPRTIPRI